MTLAVLAVAVTAALVTGPAAALECEGVALDDGCLFTITGGDTADPDDGFAVTNSADVPLWDFVRERDLQAIGYPISQRWVDRPFTLQAFQKVILQWDPGKSRMNYYNTLDVLANRYPDIELPNVPPHQVLEADQGADFATITRNHLALLDQNAAIKERFLSEPDWLELYGLPISYEEREVNGHPRGLQMLRAQRTVFVIWNVPTPGTTVGRVNLQNVPDKVKRLRNVIIPDAAKIPLARDAAERYLGILADRTALAALYHATDGPNWRNNANWLSAAPHGEWHGVTTDRQGRVTELHLASNQMRGDLPPELRLLASLARLNFRNNQLSGSIPPELGGLANLHALNLAANELRGMIPAELGNLTELNRLELSDNDLSGAIPSELGSIAGLQGLDLGSNQLRGAIPPELGRLADLETLDLSWNLLTGPIPPELARLAKLEWLWLRGNHLRGCVPVGLHEVLHHDLKDLSLPDCGDPDHVPADSPAAIAERAALEALYHATDGANWNVNTNWLSGAPVAAWHGVTTDRGLVTQIDLADNNLRGALPPELGNLEHLIVLSLRDNQLHGAIPGELGGIEDLRHLDLANNRLTGAIPAELGDLANLTWLSLPGNQLQGTIPPDLGRLSNLRYLYLDGNQLHGAIPPELGGLSNLQYLHLECNQLQGAIPPELGNLAKLIRLRLAENRLTGEIPPEKGRLAELRELHANTNQLTGTIPPGLGDLARLTELRLHENQLSGAIPPAFGKLAAMEELRLGNNQFTGTIPPELGSLANLTTLHLNSNQLQGQIPPSLGSLTKLIELRLDENQLRGPIPPELGRLLYVQELWLRGNQLDGAFPPEFAGLVNVRRLFLGGGNRFTGCIPRELGQTPSSDLSDLGIPFCPAS